MCCGGCGIGIVDPCFLTLLDGIGLRSGVISHCVLIFFPVFCENKLFCGFFILECVFSLACLDYLKELCLESSGDEDVGADGVYDVTADIAELCAVGKKHAVSVKGVFLLPYCKGRSFVCISLQSRKLKLEVDCLSGNGRRNDILIRDTDHCAVLESDAVEILALFGDGIGHVTVGELTLILLKRENELCLNDALKLLVGSCGISELVVFNDTCVVLVLYLHTVEKVVLCIGRNHSADEGEEEHYYEYCKTYNGNAVSEKALCNKCSGRKHLNASVVV